MTEQFSVVLPAKNEARGLSELLPRIAALYPRAEIVVVDDGSSDETAQVCRSNGATVISHPYSMGNGAAIKSGARSCSHDIIVFMDADGQHDPEDIAALIERMDQGYEMVVGARQAGSQASTARRIANWLYNRLASVMTGCRIEDLTSGFRAVRRRHFLKFLYLLPNGFSYPTTSTMAFFRSGLPVAYTPIHAAKRYGKSNISLLKDGLRFFVIILKIGALFSPMRFFLPISGVLFLLGASYYAYTFVHWGRLTNMTAILVVSALLTFLIGIVSEQISSLHYKHADDNQRRTVRPKPGTDG
jgi:glycosyltransferase involved in cell wall biosynthesis